MKTTAIFLDRDGVINVAVRGKWNDHEDDFALYPYTIEALRLLNTLNVPIFVVTNQSGVARGTLPHSQYYAMTAKMLKAFEENGITITRVVECLHPKDGSYDCPCRKPKTGMIDRIKHEYQLEPGRMWMVGDMATDIKMAHNAKLTPIMVQTGLCNDKELAEAIQATQDVGKDLYVDTDLLKACKRIVRCSPDLDSTS
jgi:D-glycero-D-manno-heptose 1,7-bisphosphate phosphatase